MTRLLQTRQANEVHQARQTPQAVEFPSGAPSETEAFEIPEAAETFGAIESLDSEISAEASTEATWNASLNSSGRTSGTAIPATRTAPRLDIRDARLPAEPNNH